MNDRIDQLAKASNASFVDRSIPAIIFTRELSSEEIEALRAEWKRLWQGPRDESEVKILEKHHDIAGVP